MAMLLEELMSAANIDHERGDFETHDGISGLGPRPFATVSSEFSYNYKFFTLNITVIDQC